MYFDRKASLATDVPITTGIRCVYTAYTMYPFYYIRVIYYYYYTVPAYTRYTIYSVGTRVQCGMTVYTL